MCRLYQPNTNSLQVAVEGDADVGKSRHSALGRKTSLRNLKNAVQMNQSSQYHENMKDLMTLKPNVKFARVETLGNAESIDDGTGNVKEGHEEKPTNLRRAYSVPKTFQKYVVHTRNDARKPESNIQSCPNAAIFGR